MRCISFVYAVGTVQISGLIIYKPFMSWDFKFQRKDLENIIVSITWCDFDVFTGETLSFKACYFSIHVTLQYCERCKLTIKK